ESGLEVATLSLGEGLLFDQAVVVARRRPTAGDWLVMGAGSGLAGALAKERDGVLLAAEASAAEVRRTVASRAWQGVVYVAEPAQTDVPAAAQACCTGALHLVQALAETGSTARLWLVTQGAVGIDGTEAVPAVAQASLWGVGAVARLEHPEWRCVRVDVDGLSALVAELGRRDGEEQVAWRGGQRHVARLRRRAWPGAAPSPSIRSDRSYVVTGGLGGLGLSVSGWLVEQGARHLLLLGRRGPSAAAQAVLAGLRAQGARIETRAVDVSDRQALADALLLCGRDLPGLVGVVHAAGELDDGALEQLDAARFARVLAAKVAGAWHLHELTRGMELEQFVLFSSAASLVGNPGQANHAAANAFLDGLAQHRRAQGLAGLSINWGAWGEVGAAAGHPGLKRGTDWTRFIDPDLGIAALAQLMADDAVATAVLPIDWTKFHVDHPASRQAPFYEAFVRGHADMPSTPPTSRRVVSGGSDDSDSLLRAALAEVLEVAPETLEPDQPLHDLGFDSLMAIALRNRIRFAFGVELGLRTILQGASLAKLLEEIERQRNVTPLIAAEPIEPGTVRRETIELTSMSDRDRDAMLHELLDEQDVAGASR
ncbi:MAG TPA: SDR family NAD(P)-dependent oxidoreductase, partial [Reyranella sp.]|nr:SDR family NAD(P)-dependent oxidoreductase [Reyranella sp.]